MAKPSSLPTWSGSGNLVTPSSGEQTTGFAASSIPPSGWFNWFWNLVTQWLTYLDTKIHEDVEYFIPGCEFKPDPDAVPSHSNIGWGALTSGATKVFAGLRIPLGSVINEITAYVYQADTEQMTINIKEYDNIGGSSATNTIESKTSSTGSGYGSVVFDSGDTNIPHTMSTKPVFIEVSLPATSSSLELFFYGVKIAYSVPEA